VVYTIKGIEHTQKRVHTNIKKTHIHQESATTRGKYIV